jgi:cytochrome bd-type quinol oxidase subunit 1
MRTSEALTNVPDLVIPFVMFLVIYIGLAVILAWLLYKHVIIEPEESAYEPREEATHA